MVAKCETRGIVWFKALAIYPVAKGLLLHNLAPVVTLILAPFLIKERPSFNHFIAIITGFLGLSLILDINLLNRGVLELGAVLSLITGVCSGFQDILQRKLSKKVPGSSQALIFILGQALVSVLVLIPNLPATITWTDFGSILYFGVMGTAIPIILLSNSFKSLKSFEVATLGYTEPAFGAAWGGLFLGQSFAPATAIGGALIFLSSLTAIKEEQKMKV